MQARPGLTPFGVTDPSRLDPYLERRSFAPGACLMRQGTAGDESHGVIAYLIKRLARPHPAAPGGSSDA